MRVSTCAELRRALAAAHADAGCFQLIEVMLPRGKTLATLAGFVSAVRAMSALKNECPLAPRAPGSERGATGPAGAP